VLRWAVERQFTVIGKALSVLRRMALAVAAQIPDVGQIVAFRNILVHGYAGVDDKLVWGVIEEELGTLTVALATLLQTPA
jgi:uncharacterized protein with HEPN domain